MRVKQRRFFIFFLGVFFFNFNSIALEISSVGWKGFPLALSLSGIQQGFFYQLLTYPLVLQPSGFLIDPLSAGLNGWLWSLMMAGVQEIYGWRKGSFFCLGSILSGGLFFLGYSKIFSVSPLLKDSTIFFCTLWLLLSCSREFNCFFDYFFDKSRFFLLTPTTAGILPVVISFLSGLVIRDFSYFSVFCGSFLFCYLFILFVLKIHGPYKILHPFERWIQRIFLSKLSSDNSINR